MLTGSCFGFVLNIAARHARKEALRIRSLISVVVTLIVIGLLLWLVNNYIPMDGKIKQILNVVVVVAVILWLLSAFGLLGDGCDMRVPQLRTTR